MLRFPVVLFLGILLSGCVPRKQFEALTIERNFYRNQVVTADSIAEVRQRTMSDSLVRDDSGVENRIRQMDRLAGTNRSLHAQLADVQKKYDRLLMQDGMLLSAGDNGINTEDRKSTGDLFANLDRREAELRNREARLEARERKWLRDAMNSGEEPTPATYASKSGNQGTTPLDPMSDATVDSDRLEDELRQLMISLADSGYLLDRPTEFAVRLVVAKDLLFDAKGYITVKGESVLRSLAATVRNYGQARFTLVGHAEIGEGTAHEAYAESGARAAKVALQLARFGTDPGIIVAGGMGYYGPPSDVSEGASAETERTEVIIWFPS